ncbi:unnamed protein product [Ilex paraguariensis]|uniref:Protein kinase domain-containing protein n=1 Tax=Ilex paraguariensis TaxID=185542 RepID=A0ABC8STF0_9AQUA
MGSSQILKYLMAMALFLLCIRAIAVEEPPIGSQGEDREALLALKSEFNNSFLDDNWTSLIWNMNNTPNWYGIQCLNGRVTGILLENMSLTGEIKADALVNLIELSILSFKNNSISGNLMDFSKNQKLREIDLSGNQFDGSISTSLLSLNLLESLQLQDNRLTGSIPDFHLPNLRKFNVSNNDLSGPIPNALQSFNYNSSYEGNKDLCGPPSPTDCDSTNTEASKANNSNGSTSRFAAILIVVDVVGLIVIFFLFIVYCKKSRRLKKQMERLERLNLVVKEEEKKDETQIEITEERSRIIQGEQEKGKLTFMDDHEMQFELADLLKASADGLGKGNFGSCYKAVVNDGLAVVVKRLRDLKPLSSDEFVKQLILIADLKHPNLLPLLAYYYSNDEKLLMNRFALNGNVYNRLHGGKGTKDRIPFRWSSRLAVARGVARALEYLHLNHKSQTIVVPHGNLKSSNVLLDENNMVLVSDYGFTLLVAPPLAAQRMTSYKSPEYQTYKKVSRKSDVWSYGCLLLELLTGRIPINSAPQGINGVELCSWVHRAVREEWTAEIFDVEISVQRVANNGMVRLLQIALKCCDKSPEKRPEMSEVVREIDNIKVVANSEDEEDFSMDPSLTDDSISATPSLVISGEE